MPVFGLGAGEVSMRLLVIKGRSPKKKTIPPEAPRADAGSLSAGGTMSIEETNGKG